MWLSFHLTKSVINTRTKEKPTHEVGFSFALLWEIRTEVRIRGESRVLGISSLFIFIKNAVSCQARHFVAGFAELATVFYFIRKPSHRLASPLLLSAIHSASLYYSGRSRASRAYHGHARFACSLASALTTAHCRYQPFAGKSVITTLFVSAPAIVAVVSGYKNLVGRRGFSLGLTYAHMPWQLM